MRNGVKALSFAANGRATYGLLLDGSIYEASDSLRERCPDLRALLTADALTLLPQQLADKPLDANAVRYLPVIPNPDKIICVGVNYRPHVEEMGREPPAKPLLFVRFAGSVVGHREDIIKPRASEQYDFEGELAIVIGRRARHVAREDAFDFVAGYSCFMDGSVRDWQRHTSQFIAGKNFQKSAALGPYLLSCDELADPRELILNTRVNGERMQDGKIADLIFDIPALIEYCSTFTELLPGDILSTGTPGGVGAARTPSVWLKAGDRVVVDLGPVGCLENTVAEE